MTTVGGPGGKSSVQVVRRRISMESSRKTERGSVTSERRADLTERAASSSRKPAARGDAPRSRSDQPTGMATSSTDTGRANGGGSAMPGDKQGERGTKPTKEFFDDLAEPGQSSSRHDGQLFPRQVSDGAAQETNKIGGDAPALPIPSEIAKKVSDIIEDNPFLRKAPKHVKEYLKAQIDTLPRSDQIEIAQRINTLVESRGFKRLVQVKAGARAEVRLQKTIDKVHQWTNQEAANLQAQREIKVTADTSGATGPIADPALREMAAQPPTIAEERSKDVRAYSARTADKVFQESVQKMLDQHKTWWDRRKLLVLISLQILLAAVHSTVPPER